MPRPAIATVVRAAPAALPRTLRHFHGAEAAVSSCWDEARIAEWKGFVSINADSI
jgi:hypothetical protein